MGVSGPHSLISLNIQRLSTTPCFEVNRVHQIMALSTIYVYHPKKFQLSGDPSSSQIPTSLHILESVPMFDTSPILETLPLCPLDPKLSQPLSWGITALLSLTPGSPWGHAATQSLLRGSISSKTSIPERGCLENYLAPHCHFHNILSFLKTSALDSSFFSKSLASSLLLVSSQYYSIFNSNDLSNHINDFSNMLNSQIIKLLSSIILI